jgi:hypothetical protein
MRLAGDPENAGQVGRLIAHTSAFHRLHGRGPQRAGVQIAQINELPLGILDRIPMPAIDDVAMPARLAGTGGSNEGEVAAV